MTQRFGSTRREFLWQLGGLGALASMPARLSAQEALPTRPIPATGEELPIVGFGSTKAVLEIPREGVEPVEAVIRMLLERGGRVVDTSVRPADIDAAFAPVLRSPGIREEIFLATKVNTEDAATGVAQLMQTEQLFGRENIDLIQVESLRGVEHHWPRLLAMKAEGRTRYVGVTVQSAASHALLEAFMRSESPDFVHLNYSLLEPNAEERLLPLARDLGMAVIVNRPFMNGTFFGRVEGRTLPEWAVEFDCETWAQFSLKYILANPAVTCVLTETTDPAHMAENIGAGMGRLPDAAQLRRMRDVATNL